MVNDLLLQKARAYVEALIRDRKPGWVNFHDFHHATSVADACRVMGSALNFDDGMIEVLSLAAWFHDVGYLGGIEGHEERSVELAASFLLRSKYPKEKIAQVAGCIRATKMPQKPKNILEQVLCDADIAHLSSKDYLRLSERVRLEIEHQRGRSLSDTEWLAMNIAFVAGHRYFTDYAKTHFEKQRRLNLATLRERLRRLNTGRDAKPSRTQPQSAH